MRNLIRHLKAAWFYGRQFPLIPAAEAAEYWEPVDAEELRRFFNSRTGRKLSRRLTNFIIKKAVFTVNNPSSTPYDNGLAAGLPAMIAAIDAHLPAVSPNTDKSEDPDEAASEILEHFAA